MVSSFQFESPAYPLSGPRVKAGFHCHTINSDGGLTPHETVQRYRAENFQCLGITDHRQVTPVDDLQSQDFLALGATENGGDPDIIGVGVNTAVPEKSTLTERAASLAEQGGFTIAAHPTYCAVLPETYIKCPDLMAMEIYNAYCDAAYTNGYAVELWDMVLGAGKRIWGVAGDDAHLNPRKRYYSNAGLGWVEVWTDKLTPDSVVQALREGRFFSTQGPVFNEITIANNRIDVRCGPVRQVRWRTWGKVGYVDYAPDNTPLVASSLPDWFQPSKYIRIELVDENGKKAWSNPIFVK